MSLEHLIFLRLRVYTTLHYTIYIMASHVDEQELVIHGLRNSLVAMGRVCDVCILQQRGEPFEKQEAFLSALLEEHPPYTSHPPTFRFIRCRALIRWDVAFIR